MEKIDQTIEDICDFIQALIHAGRAEDVAELTNALANLMTARANLNMSARMHKGIN